MFMNTRTEREKSEREGRTFMHVGDFIRIPFWEITVELRGTPKRYKWDIKRRVIHKKGNRLVVINLKYV